MMLAKCLIQCLKEILMKPWIVSDWWLTMVVIPIIIRMLVLGALSAWVSLGDAISGKEIHGRIYRHEPWARVEWQRLGCKCIPLSSSVDLTFLLRCKYKQIITILHPRQLTLSIIEMVNNWSLWLASNGQTDRNLFCPNRINFFLYQRHGLLNLVVLVKLGWDVSSIEHHLTLGGLVLPLQFISLLD